MYRKLITLSLISTFALSACGGGSDDTGTTQPINNQPSNTQSNNQKQSNTNQSTSNTTSQNSSDTQNQITIHTFNKSTSQVTSVSKAGNDGDNYTNLIVDGKTIGKLPSSIITGAGDKIDMVLMKGKPDNVDGANSDYVLSYARFGAIIDKKEMKATTFYQGSPTDVADMPTNGEAVYIGTAAAMDTDKLKAAYTGFTTLFANFSDKKLSGTLHLEGQSIEDGLLITGTSPTKNIKIDANIKANTFMGKANDKGTVEGKFYGPQAQTIAGAFIEPDMKIQGVFGGNKQKKP